MAKGTMYCCKKSEYNSIHSRYASLLAGKKRAHKSKGAKGITIKKKSVVSADITTFEKDDHDEIRKLVYCDNDAKEVAAVCSIRVKKDTTPKYGEFIGHDEPEKMKDFGMGFMCRSRDLISGCGSIDDYETLNEISHGSFGIVYRARDRKTGQIVAIKEEFDGLCFSSLREIDILKSLHHPSIVEFKQVAVDDYDGVYVVMEYVETDLHEYMKRLSFSSPGGEVKRLMKELLEGVKYLHRESGHAETSNLPIFS
ncbi:hypothetical protein DH2020_042561 [Rehmannia glutinosa]|uniref:Protein kinase domain-containing protein n=1 Tax=Rehmannia glutinosa TaxID=99300 RepID=A0ABR0UMK0_REHGL